MDEGSYEYHLAMPAERADGVTISIVSDSDKPDVFVEAGEGIWRYSRKDVLQLGAGDWQAGISRIRQAYIEANSEQLTAFSPALLLEDLE